MFVCQGLSNRMSLGDSLTFMRRPAVSTTTPSSSRYHHSQHHSQFFHHSINTNFVTGGSGGGGGGGGLFPSRHEFAALKSAASLLTSREMGFGLGPAEIPIAFTNNNNINNNNVVSVSTNSVNALGILTSTSFGINSRFFTIFFCSFVVL